MRIAPAGTACLVDFGPYALHSSAGLAIRGFGGKTLVDLERVVVVRAVVTVAVDFLIAHFWRWTAILDALRMLRLDVYDGLLAALLVAMAVVLFF